MKKKLLLLFLCLLAFVSPSFACDCDGEEATIEASYVKSTSVFLGRVVAVKNYKLTANPKQEDIGYYIIEFQTEEVYKGERAKKISVLAEATVCGIGFIEGNTYLIFTFTNELEKKLEYHQCFRMRLLKQSATEEIERLRTTN